MPKPKHIDQIPGGRQSPLAEPFWDQAEVSDGHKIEPQAEVASGDEKCDPGQADPEAPAPVGDQAKAVALSRQESGTETEVPATEETGAVLATDDVALLEEPARTALARQQQALTALQERLQRLETARLADQSIPAAGGAWNRWAAGTALILAVVALGLALFGWRRDAGIDPDLLVKLAALAQAAGETDQALEFLDDAMATGLTEADTLAQVGQTYYDLEQYPQAVDILEQAVGTAPNDETIRLALARSYGQAGQQPEAIMQYRRLLELNPVNWRYYYELGERYEALPNYHQALAQYQRVVEIEPTNLGAYFRQGEVYRQLGQYDEAIARFRQALGLDPNHYWSLLQLGLSYEDNGEVDQAIPLYQRAVEVSPDNPNGYYRLGEAYLAGGDLAAAGAAYQQALELSPNWAEAHRGLGQAYLAHQGDCRQALPAFLTVLEQQPNNEAALTGLAECQGLE